MHISQHNSTPKDKNLIIKVLVNTLNVLLFYLINDHILY